MFKSENFIYLDVKRYKHMCTILSCDRKNTDSEFIFCNFHLRELINTESVVKFC